MTGGWIQTMVISVLVWAPAAPAAGTDSVNQPTPEVSGQDAEAMRTPRLRFRSGPLCMCSQGMSEADIMAAERERLESVVLPQDDVRR